MKTCSKCKEEKELTEFSFRKEAKDGFRGVCKVCTVIARKQYQQNNHEAILNRKIEFRALDTRISKECIKCKEVKSFDKFNVAKANKDGFTGTCKNCETKWRKQYSVKNKDKQRKYHQKYNQDNKELISKKSREYRLKNKKTLKKKQKKYYSIEKNRIAAIKRAKEWQDSNRERINKRNKEKYHSDNLLKLRLSLRNRTSQAFKSKGWKKGSKSMDMLGVSIEVAKAHLERQFTKGMTWENNTREGWHIDHIIPLSSAKDEEALRKLCHYTNLQPLWAKDNLKKNGKIIETQIKLRI